MSTLENFGNYKLGGYHPIEIGDELHNGCYRILHRLGHGSYSTVWLALNQRFDMESEPRSRYVAIKVLIANASDAKYDGSIMRYLQLHKPSSASENNEMTDGRAFVVSLLDEFEIHGPNGLHRCIVTEVLGPSIMAVQQCMELHANTLTLEIARRVLVQCAKGMAFLHSRGVVHGGMERHLSRRRLSTTNGPHRSPAQ
jgi:serine/threonine-protein kinase SRPK3